MLVIIPYWQGDQEQASRLAEWMRVLDDYKNHKCLLIQDFTVDTSIGICVKEILAQVFESVDTFVPHYKVKVQWGKGDGSTTGDATCPNNMFRAAAVKVLNHYKCPWLWLEPDSVPLKKGWLDDIEREYRTLGKPFMGDQVLWPNAPEHMSGNGVYPARVCDYSILALRSGRGAFDVNAAHQIIRHCGYTQLIQHVWRFGGPGGPVPTFPTPESLGQIEEEAVIFHRCKDGTLIDRLRERLSVPALAEGTPEALGSVSRKAEELTTSNPDGAQSITVTLSDSLPLIDIVMRDLARDELKEKRRANLAKARAAKKAKFEKRKAAKAKRKASSFPGPDTFHVVTGK